jgi:hypothetical protein
MGQNDDFRSAAEYVRSWRDGLGCRGGSGVEFGWRSLPGCSSQLIPGADAPTTPSWRLKSEWDASISRPLCEDPIVRLIPGGTVVRVRLDTRATSIALVGPLGVRATVQNEPPAIKAWAGGGGGGLARAALRSHQTRVEEVGADHRWRPAGPGKRRWLYAKRRNLLGHAPQWLHEENRVVGGAYSTLPFGGRSGRDGSDPWVNGSAHVHCDGAPAAHTIKTRAFLRQNGGSEL